MSLIPGVIFKNKNDYWHVYIESTRTDRWWDDDDPKVCSCICNDIAVVVFRLKAYVFDHLWQNQEEKKKDTTAEFKKLCTLRKRRADQSVEPIVFIWLRVTAKGGRLIKKFHKSGKCFLTLCVNGTDNVLHPFKQCWKWTIKDKVKVQMRDYICSLW